MEQTLGKRIARNRKQLKLTQEQLAEKLGVTAQAVSKWENDQSCPDIATLPKIAEIFHITVDELLGIEQSGAVHSAEVVEDDECENNGIHIQKGNWELRLDKERISSLGFAVLVLSVGLLYLLSQILAWELSFWDILWPTSLLVIGLWCTFQKFSFFKIGCALFGGYALAGKLFHFSLSLDRKLIWAVLIVLFGTTLLADAIKKPKKFVFAVNGPASDDKIKNNSYQCTDSTFTYTGRFGGTERIVTLDTLQHGEINVSFGEYTFNLSEINHVTDDCTICVHCSFGALRLIVPSRYKIVSEPSTSFGDVKISEIPDVTPIGTIHIDGCINFGELEIEYI